MSNYYAPCFYRINFVVIPSYIELPCSDRKFLVSVDFFSWFTDSSQNFLVCIDVLFPIRF